MKIVFVRHIVFFLIFAFQIVNYNMKHLSVAFFLLLAVFFTTACDSETDGRRFDFDLRGTWYSNDPSRYSGELIIEYDRITILGYLEGQTPLLGDDAERPFGNFTKGTALSGYSESFEANGVRNYIIYIMDVGVWHELASVYYTGSNRNDRFMRINFGARTETLRRE